MSAQAARETGVRVCHLIHRLQPGGAEDVLVGLGDVATAAGIDLTVVSLVPDHDSRHRRELEARGIPVICLLGRTRWDPRTMGRAIRAIRAARADIIHTHLKHADIVGAYCSWRLGIPLVSSLHLIEDTTTRIGRMRRWAGAQARNRRATRILAVSDELRRWYVSMFAIEGRRVRTVPNGIASPSPAAAKARLRIRAALGIRSDTVVLIMVALMRRTKGHLDLLNACSKLPRDLDIHVLLAGDGPNRATILHRLAHDRDLRRRVTLLGFRQDIDELVSASDLLVHPSHDDALPTAVIRALANGIPVLATRVGGIPEIVTEAEGVLVDPGDVEALTGAIIGLAGDSPRRRRMGDAGRRRFEEHFEATQWAGRLRRIYDEVLTETAAATGPMTGPRVTA